MVFQFQDQISKRYLTNQHVENILKSLNKKIFNVTVAGKSVRTQNVYRIDFGTGAFKILLWSQMHGNETTTTRAVLNFLNSLNADENKQWLQFFTFTFLPVLNPDGAEDFTRVNANKVDLNRDSCDLTQPESNILRNVFNEVQPNLALNMHDQRTIFSAGKTNKTATLSFLTPAFNEGCEINETRTFAMQLIAAMRYELNEAAPDTIGRFDDAFNINCIGDMFTYLNTPTILFEAGFAANDYQRNTAVELVQLSLENLCNSLISKSYEQFTVNDYLQIPENHKNFVDLTIHNFQSNNSKYSGLKELPVVFKEELVNSEIHLSPEIDFDSAPNYQYAHQSFNANQQTIDNNEDLRLVLKNLMIY